MAQIMPFRIGADASCTDGACGQVSRIIVNPAGREVTHLVVDPKHRRGPGRLVPVDLADATTGPIRLGCTLAEFRTLQPAQESSPYRTSTRPGTQGSSSNQAKWRLSAIVPGRRAMPATPADRKPRSRSPLTPFHPAR